MGGSECDPPSRAAAESPTMRSAALPVGSSSEGCWAGARAPRVLREWALWEGALRRSAPSQPPPRPRASHTLIAALFIYFFFLLSKAAASAGASAGRGGELWGWLDSQWGQWQGKSTGIHPLGPCTIPLQPGRSMPTRRRDGVAVMPGTPGPPTSGAQGAPWGALAP